MTRIHKGKSKTSQRADTSQSKLRDMHVEEELDTSTSGPSKDVVSQAIISTSHITGESLDVGALETWLWDAACSIRGATDAQKFKDFILPLIFYKRLSNVFDDEFVQYSVKYGTENAAESAKTSVFTRRRSGVRIAIR